MKCERDSDGRKLDHVSLKTMRTQAVKAIQAGQSVQSVADAYRVNVRSVFRWLATYASGGQKALQAKPIPGRPPALSGEQLAWLAGAVRDHTPQQYRFDFALWTLGLISDLIERRFQVSLSRSAVGRVTRTLGLTPQRPLYRAAQRDDVWVERWQKEEFPAIAAEAKRVGATILFADEASIRSDYHAGTTWAPIRQTPVVEATGRRFSLNPSAWALWNSRSAPVAQTVFRWPRKSSPAARTRIDAAPRLGGRQINSYPRAGRFARAIRDLPRCSQAFQRPCRP